MFAIPLQATPNQAVRFNAGGYACQVTLFQKRTGLFANVFVEDAPILFGVRCMNMRRLVRSAYLGFPGDLVFRDTQGSKDPDYTGLSERFRLICLSPAETPSAYGAR